MIESDASIKIAVAVPGSGPSMTDAVVMHHRMDEAAFQVFYFDTAPKLRGYLRRISAMRLLRTIFCRIRFCGSCGPSCRRWRDWR